MRIAVQSLQDFFESFLTYSDGKVSRDFLEALFVVIWYPPPACVAAPVPHAIGFSSLATLFHWGPPFHLLAALKHFIAVTSKTHTNLAHAILAVKTSDSSALFARDRRPLCPPFAASSPHPAVKDLPCQQVHRAVTQGHVTGWRARRGVQLCSQGPPSWSVDVHSLRVIDFQGPLVYLEYSQGVDLLLYEFPGDDFQQSCLWWFRLPGLFGWLRKDFGSYDC